MSEAAQRAAAQTPDHSAAIAALRQAGAAQLDPLRLHYLELLNARAQTQSAAVQGLLTRAYYELAIGQDDRYAGFKLIAGKVYENYLKKTASVKSNSGRIGLPAYDLLNRTVLNQLLDPEKGAPFAMRAVLRTQLGMPAETVPTPSAPVTGPGENSTNNAPAK